MFIHHALGQLVGLSTDAWKGVCVAADSDRYVYTACLYLYVCICVFAYSSLCMVLVGSIFIRPIIRNSAKPSLSVLTKPLQSLYHLWSNCWDRILCSCPQLFTGRSSFPGSAIHIVSWYWYLSSVLWDCWLGNGQGVQPSSLLQWYPEWCSGTSLSRVMYSELSVSCFSDHFGG